MNPVFDVASSWTPGKREVSEVIVGRFGIFGSTRAILFINTTFCQCGRTVYKSRRNLLGTASLVACKDVEQGPKVISLCWQLGANLRKYLVEVCSRHERRVKLGTCGERITCKFGVRQNQGAKGQHIIRDQFRADAAWTSLKVLLRHKHEMLVPLITVPNEDIPIVTADVFEALFHQAV